MILIIGDDVFESDDFDSLARVLEKCKSGVNANEDPCNGDPKARSLINTRAFREDPRYNTEAYCGWHDYNDKPVTSGIFSIVGSKFQLMHLGEPWPKEK